MCVCLHSIISLSSLDSFTFAPWMEPRLDGEYGPPFKLICASFINVQQCWAPAVPVCELSSAVGQNCRQNDEFQFWKKRLFHTVGIWFVIKIKARTNWRKRHYVYVVCGMRYSIQLFVIDFVFVHINKFNVFDYTIPLKMTRRCIFEFQIVISVDISHKMKKNSALLHCCIVWDWWFHDRMIIRISLNNDNGILLFFGHQFSTKVKAAG